MTGMTQPAPPQSRVTSVAPTGAAARAGIVVGDSIDYAHMSAASRFYILAQPPLAGTPLTLAVVHHGVERSVGIVALGLPSDPISPWKRAVAALLLALAGTLLLLHPQRATWAFMAYAMIEVVNLCNQYVPYPAGLGFFAFSNFIEPLDVVALLYFSIWFLQGEERRWHRPVTNVVLAAGVAFAVLWLFASVAPLTLRSFPIPTYIQSLWELGIAVLTLFVLIEAYITGRRIHRQKIAWVVAALAFALVFDNIAPQFFDLSAQAHLPILFLVLYGLNSISPLVVASALLYAMTQYRVVDLRFAMSRALVYGTTTAFLVGIFALVEWAAGRLFEGTDVAAYAGLFAALLIAFAANWLHRHADQFIDAIFFRRARLAANRLRHIAASLLYTDTESTIVTFLVDEPAKTLDLASAALFLAAREKEPFKRVGDHGWAQSELSTIDLSDEIVPQLRAETKPLGMPELHWRPGELPHGIAAPVVAIGLKARGDLFGVVFYGAHTDGAAINSDERELLATLAFNAASAYAHIEAARARAEISELHRRLQLAGESGARS